MGKIHFKPLSTKCYEQVSAKKHIIHLVKAGNDGFVSTDGTGLLEWKYANKFARYLPTQQRNLCEVRPCITPVSDNSDSLVQPILTKSTTPLISETSVFLRATLATYKEFLGEKKNTLFTFSLLALLPKPFSFHKTNNVCWPIEIGSKYL